MITWILNLILPGTGLVVRRREWLGLSTAVLFAICGNVAIAGWAIAPAAVPGWLTRLALAMGLIAWLWAQILYYRQGRVLARTRRVLMNLLDDARVALASNDLPAARRALDGAAALDDENVELHVLRARLCEKEGAREAMRAAWHRVLTLDRRSAFAREARAALHAETRPPGAQP